MDSLDDEPRKYPSPLPFCEAIPKPSVPEVSLISLDNFENQREKKNDSFSGTEFQTYNAWRWKYMKSVEKSIVGEKKFLENSGEQGGCCLIKDKYSTSETEKRKNEILYGKSVIDDEPRQPFPPKKFSDLPRCPEVFSSGSSLDDFRPFEKQLTLQHKRNSPTQWSEKYSKRNDVIYNGYYQEGFDNSKLHDIISEQNKQVEVLQKQMEQILKLQDIKDKQIEQLLNSQQMKEKKIKQLLQLAEMKDSEIEKLLKLREKQEEHLQDLINCQEKLENKNFEMQEKLKTLVKKDSSSVGVMTELQTVESTTNTDMQYCSGECCNKKLENNQDLSCIKNADETDRFNDKDKSLSLHSTDLPIQEQVLTPQSSIHVDIQDFNCSSDESDSDSDTVHNKCTMSKPSTNAMGYTFYNNVISQVKDIIQNSGDNKMCANSQPELTKQPYTDNNFILKEQGIKQSLEAWQILEKENISPTSNFHKRFQYDLGNAGLKDTYSPSDISLKINSLALKYLNKDEISKYNVQAQIASSRQPDVTIYNVTNLSFGSARYLDRCRILPNITENPLQSIAPQKVNDSPKELFRRKKK